MAHQRYFVPSKVTKDSIQGVQIFGGRVQKTVRQTAGPSVAGHVDGQVTVMGRQHWNESVKGAGIVLPTVNANDGSHIAWAPPFCRQMAVGQWNGDFGALK